MALTYHEAQIVKSTIPYLKDHGESISDTVYKTLLKGNPELNNIFNLVHLKDGRLARALTTVILRFASSINNITELIPELERICNKHCSLSIQPEHYKVLGELMINTFQDTMGPLMTSEMKAAWIKAYNILSHMMIGREQFIYNDFGRYKWGTWRKFTVERKVCEADGMFSFYLVPKDDLRLPYFLPGQYISIRLFVPEAGYYQTRQYSLSDIPRARDCYRITVKKVGADISSHGSGMVSTILIDRVRTGEEIECSHPIGEFFVDTTVSSTIPIILISAGSGVGPLMSILNAVTEGQSARHVSWIYGCREDLPFETRLAVVKRRCPNLHTAVFKTAPIRGDTQGVTYDFEGRVDLHKVPREMLHATHGSAEYYICGPEAFMKAMIQQLVGMGIDTRRIKCEVFSVGDLKMDSVCGYSTPSDSRSLSSRTSSGLSDNNSEKY